MNNTPRRVILLASFISFSDHHAMLLLPVVMRNMERKITAKSYEKQSFICNKLNRKTVVTPREPGEKEKAAGGG